MQTNEQTNKQAQGHARTKARTRRTRRVRQVVHVTHVTDASHAKPRPYLPACLHQPIRKHTHTHTAFCCESSVQACSSSENRLGTTSNCWCFLRGPKQGPELCGDTLMLKGPTNKFQAQTCDNEFIARPVVCKRPKGSPTLIKP